LENFKYDFVPKREKLEIGRSKLTVNLNGGMVEDLVLKGVKILGRYKDINGKERATHICCPFFDVEGMEKYNMPRHGIARDVKWNKNGFTGRDDYLRIEAMLQPTELYKSRLLVSQIFELTDGKFKQTIVVANGGEKEVPVNFGVHNYWKTFEGWDEAKINGENISQGIKENDVDKALKMEKDNVIYIPGLEPINWHLENFSRCVLWTARKEVKGEILYDRQFMCAEPVMEVGDFFGSEESMLGGGEKIQASQTISF